MPSITRFPLGGGPQPGTSPQPGPTPFTGSYNIYDANASNNGRNGPASDGGQVAPNWVYSVQPGQTLPNNPNIWDASRGSWVRPETGYNVGQLLPGNPNDPNTNWVTAKNNPDDYGGLMLLAAGLGPMLAGAGMFGSTLQGLANGVGGAATGGTGAFDMGGMGSATDLFTSGAGQTSLIGGAGADTLGANGMSGFLDPFDLQPDPYITYQDPNAMNLGAFGGGADASNSLFGGGGIGNLLSGGKGIGALLGALAGGLGGGQKPAGQVTSVNDIPDWLKPYVINNLNAATSKANQLGGSTPLLGPAQDEIAKTISGAYLDPSTNPYLQSTYDQAAKAVTDSYLSTTQPRTDALFYNSGAFGPGNSAYAETVARNQFGLGQNLNNLATNIFGGNYNQERGRQFGAAVGAPDFTTSYYQGAFSPFASYSNLTKGLGSTQSTPYFTNPFGSIFSGALGGAALGSAFGK